MRSVACPDALGASALDMAARVSPCPALRARIRTRARDWSRRLPPLHVFGGRPVLEAALPLSPASGRPLHLLLDLDPTDPALQGLGVASVDRLALLADLRLEASEEPLFVRHLDRGRRLELLAQPAADVIDDMPDELPQLPVELEPLSAAESAVVTLDEAPDDAPWHQVGGEPRGPRGAVAAPRCPVTGRRMSFVAQLDSLPRFPLPGGERSILFGDHGCLYAFWSDVAAISAVLAAW